MSDEKPEFKVIPGAFSAAAPKASGEQQVQSPPPPPLANLTTTERRVWEYICEQLREAGVEHRTAGITIKIVCRTYIDWIAAVKECEEQGRYIESKNGNPYEAPHSYTEKQLKRDLLKWLPQACLTIPSLAKTQGEKGGDQGDLFGELLGYAAAHPG